MSRKTRVNAPRENIVIIENKNPRPIRNRIMIGTPTLGTIRMEWAQCRFGQVIPCNWTAAHVTMGFNHSIPLGYLVADAQNIIVDMAVRENYEWLLLHEDDVMLPFDAFIRYNDYMKKADVPVVSGLYYLKCSPSEPLVYRGRGTNCYEKFKYGDLVWCDGVPTGCLLIHNSILKLMWEEAPEYTTGHNQLVKKVFETPANAWIDPESENVRVMAGTSDLYWCDTVMKNNVFARTGWKKYSKMKYPFLVDTRIACLHIDVNTGTKYPLEGIPGMNEALRRATHEGFVKARS